ncbi:uridine kinase [Solicola sp. PLA-1-18]|uniref:uridine kinase n=1 Tax=Solicola sp. PLA-1-18 TaxID=3380532 RepID=UPI003B79BEEC
MGPAHVQFSVSTSQPAPAPPASALRLRVLDEVAAIVLAAGDGRLRVAVDGRTAAGKSTFGHELAGRLADAGRPVLRASLDDFKRPWAERHLYDRESGEGFYRNAFDHDQVRDLLLDPAAPGGSGDVVLCALDTFAQVARTDVVDHVPPDGVLVVDGVFALRPELDDAWDVRVRVEVPAAVALARGVRRDDPTWSGADPTELHRDRYAAAEAVYLREVDPLSHADVVVDNTDPQAPRLLHP